MASTDRKPYSAPALEKGLDILELLAEAATSLSTQEIADALERSRSEIFRMLNVLEARGFIARGGSEEGFALTPRLLELAMKNPPTRSLLDAALPIMEALAERVGQSCHLAVESGADMVVIARIESPGEVGFAVRIGHRRNLVESTSGRVLLAFQSEMKRRAWLARVPEGVDFVSAELEHDLARIRRQGYRKAKSTYVSGIVDLGVPVFDGRSEGAIASITIPCVQKQKMREPITKVIEELVLAAERISAALAHQSGAEHRIGVV
jgi:DNA-binding IclR family transcriptional regulator